MVGIAGSTHRTVREQVWVTRGDGKHGEGEGDKIDSHRMANGVLGVMESPSPTAAIAPNGNDAHM